MARPSRLPPLTDDEDRELRSSIKRDGVQLSSPGRSARQRDRRQQPAAHRCSLGVPCEPKILEVDDETADRLRLSLNLARRYTRLPTLDQRLILAALARKHEEKAKADARARQGTRNDLKQLPDRPIRKLLRPTTGLSMTLPPRSTRKPPPTG